LNKGWRKPAKSSESRSDNLEIGRQKTEPRIPTGGSSEAQTANRFADRMAHCWPIPGGGLLRRRREKVLIYGPPIFSAVSLW